MHPVVACFRFARRREADQLWQDRKRYLKNITDKTLSRNLKELENDRLIIRKEYPQIPPKVEYSLSEKGKSLMKVLDQLCVWGEEHRE